MPTPPQSLIAVLDYLSLLRVALAHPRVAARGARRFLRSVDADPWSTVYDNDPWSARSCAYTAGRELAHRATLRRYDH